MTDVHERLVLYKRLANCDDEDALGACAKSSWTVRDAPDHARALLDSHRLRILGKPLGIARVDATEAGIQLSSCPTRPSSRPTC